MEVKHRLPLGPDVVAATIAIAMPGIVCALWLAPRAAIPAEVPPLVLRADEVRASIEAEHALAQRAPQDDARAARRSELYAEQNLAEVRGEGDRARGEQRRAAMRAELEAIAEQHGDDVVAAIRAADVERMIPALAGRGDDEERAAALGGFARSLERWGAVDGGRRVAPELVVRALFAARWNALHGLPLTHGLDPVRARAYHGWLALHVDSADGPLRASALDAYRAAGGLYAEEARGVLAWQRGDHDAAHAAFERAHEIGGSVRLRNHALAAAIATGGETGL